MSDKSKISPKEAAKLQSIKDTVKTIPKPSIYGTPKPVGTNGQKKQ